MPIDPSIIGNVMAPAAPQLPDVNAMLETQTRGAENIYKIERQRQADAAAAQEKATANQEAATIKALLPAYTYLIQTGNVAGVSSLVPPDMLETVQPYIDALAGKPPEEVKAAAIGSLSSSAMGQEALAAIQRAGTLSVQQGQLTLAQQKVAAEAEAAARGPQMTPGEAARLAFDKEKFAADQAAKLEAPKIKLEAGRAKVDDTLSEMLRSYNKLKQEGAIVSTEASGVENVIARASAGLGTTAGRALGTKAQTERDYIQSLRMNLINDIKTATGKSSQELNSNFELQAALDALSDPYSQSFETALRTIAKISRDYGKGEIATPETAPAGAGGELRRYDSTGKRIQ